MRIPSKGDVYQHKKSGCRYVVLENALLESDKTQVVVYRGTDGVVWVRPLAEFSERFALLSS